MEWEGEGGSLKKHYVTGECVFVLGVSVGARCGQKEGFVGVEEGEEMGPAFMLNGLV